MTVNGAIPERAPLSVLLFHAAMSREKSLSQFAKDLDIGAISLRQFILGNTQRPRQKTLETIGEALEMPVEEVRRRMELLPEAMPRFGEWLEDHMRSRGKISRAKLTRDTKISDGALRNYLAGQTLPDSDQAARLARVLGVEALDVARLVVANTVAEAGGPLAPPESDGSTTIIELGGGPTGDTEDSRMPQAAQLAGAAPGSYDESQLLSLWRQLHPQGRRATLGYIAMLLAER